MNRDYQSYLNWTYFGDQAFDREEFERLRSSLKGVTRFIDIGASHGVYTHHANEILEDADIISIEADPERFEILQSNIEKWSNSSNRLRCINAAASDENERAESPTATFFVTGTQISGGFFPVAERSDNYQPIEVPIVCLDDFFSPNEKTFVKIDVEGSELRVLQGAINHIQAGNVKFFTELSWWGDRGRETTFIDIMFFCWQNRLRIDRRLKSDYLISPERASLACLISYVRCSGPLLARGVWNTLVPRKLRTWRERRLNKRRIGRFGDTESTSMRDS